MTPGTAQALLYNDIVPVAAVQREHDELRRVLSLVAETLEVEDLLYASADQEEGRRGLAERLLGADHPGLRELQRRWARLETAAIVRECVLGIPRTPRRLVDREPGARMLTPPLPNLYFTRDGAFVVGDSVYRAAMASPVRSAETAVADAVCSKLGLSVSQVVSDASGGWPESLRAARSEARLRDPQAMKLEGGDVLVLDRDCVLLGCGQRSSLPAIDRFLEELASGREHELTALVVRLPDERATIHLDMIVTVIDRGLLLGYEPLLRGPAAAPVTRVVIRPGEDVWHMTDHASLPEGLAAAGRPHGLVACGGHDRITQEREQWFSACNSVALAPGCIVVYRNNPATLEALAGAGFDILSAEQAEHQKSRLTGEAGRIAVAVDGVELARGGGGPRCMTMPLRRDPMPEEQGVG